METIDKASTEGMGIKLFKYYIFCPLPRKKKFGGRGQKI